MKKRKDGRYVKKITLPNGTIKYIYGKSSPEITQKERTLLKEFESGIVIGDETTVGEWAGTWFNTYKAQLKYKTKEAYLNAYNNHILPYIGKHRLRDVRAVDVQRIMNAVATNSESLQSKVLNTSRQMFNAALLNHLVADNPTIGIKIKKNTKDDKIKFLSQKQYENLIEQIQNEQAKLFCAVCLYTGLRREEALGLMWSDIEGEELTVSRAVTFQANQANIDQSLKTKAANRTVPIPDVLKELLYTYPKKNLYLFTNKWGGVMSQTAFRRMWEKVKCDVPNPLLNEVINEKNKEPYPLHPHMLRHTYATILYNADIDLKTAQYLMGHTDIKVTANIYTHIEKHVVTKSSKKINDFLSGNEEGCQEGCQEEKKA